MKKNNYISILFVTISGWLLFSSNSGGIFNADHTGNSGMANGGVSCGNSYCHGGITATDASRMEVKILNSVGQPVSTYVPSSTYTVEVSLKVYNATKAGFQSVACLFGGAGGAGTSTNTIMPAATQQTIINSTNYISHTSAGSTSAISAGYAKWQYKWVSPATNVGAITFATAGNVSNNNGQSTGDSAFNTVTILQAPTSINDIAFANTFAVYPVPSATFICVKNTDIINAKMSITNMNGVVVKTIVDYNFTQANKIDIGTLPAGFYSIVINNDHKNAVKYFAKL
jgi:hypothetical protein